MNISKTPPAASPRFAGTHRILRVSDKTEVANPKSREYALTVLEKHAKQCVEKYQKSRTIKTVQMESVQDGYIVHATTGDNRTIHHKYELFEQHGHIGNQTVITGAPDLVKRADTKRFSLRIASFIVNRLSALLFFLGITNAHVFKVNYRYIPDSPTEKQREPKREKAS